MSSALVGVLGVVLGVVLSNSAARLLEAIRRRERIKDIRTALRAEIRSHRPRLVFFREEAEKQDSGAGTSKGWDPGFTPFVPRETPSFVFDAIVGEIHVLPTEVIDPVVYYYRQVATLSQFAEDLRSERFAAIDQTRKAEIYRDYIAIGAYALDLADDAIAAIEDSSVAGLRPGRTGDGPRGRQLR